MGFGAALAEAGIANADQQEVTQFLSTGYPVLDHRLSGKYVGGGFAAGRIVEVIGPSSSGKTAIATNAMKCAQEAGGLAGFNDHERSFDAGLGESFGLNISPDHFVYDKPNTFEQSIDRMKEKVMIARGMSVKNGEYVVDKSKAYFPTDVPFVWVFDSLAAMVPHSALFDKKGEDRDAADRNMNDNTALARCTAAHFPGLAVFAEATNTCLIFLNQIRVDMTAKVMPGKPAATSSPGGKAPEFYATQRLKLGRTFITDEKAGFKKVGQTTSCEVFKNKVWRPFEKCTWDFMYMDDGTGRFDVTGGVVDELKTLGLLDTAGAYIVWEGKKYYKSQLVPFLDANPAELAKLHALLPA